ALVPDRERALSTLETDADADAVLGADAGGAGGHVEHGRAHRALLVDATVLLGEAVVDLALEGGERVVPCRELGVGVGVGLRQGLGRGGVDIGLRVGVHGGRAAAAVRGDLLVAAGRDPADGRASALVGIAIHDGGHVAAARLPGNAVARVTRTPVQ